MPRNGTDELVFAGRRFERSPRVAPTGTRISTPSSSIVKVCQNRSLFFIVTVRGALPDVGQCRGQHECKGDGTDECQPDRPDGASAHSREPGGQGEAHGHRSSLEITETE